MSHDSPEFSGMQVGVGTSVLQVEMTLDGYRQVHNIDYSEVLIHHLVQEHAGIPQLTFEVADCRCGPATPFHANRPIQSRAFLSELRHAPR